MRKVKEYRKIITLQFDYRAMHQYSKQIECHINGIMDCRMPVESRESICKQKESKYR